jgi:hypothetical protein
MTTRALAFCVFLLAGACGTPKIEGVGAGGSGGAGGRPSGGGPSGGASGGGGAPSIGVPFPDAAPAAPPAPPTGPGDKCAEESHAAQMVPLDLLLLVDSSGSMGQSAGPSSKWKQATDALLSFIRDPSSAGLGVGIQFFPQLPPPKSCMTDADCGITAPRPNFWCHVSSVCLGPGVDLASARGCDPGLSLCRDGTVCTALGRCSVTGADCVGAGTPCAGGVAGDMCMSQPRTCQNMPNDTGSCLADDYQRLAAPIAALPAAEPRLRAMLAAKVPVGGTPMGPAATGALAHLRMHLAANAGHRAALVLVTDGLPQGCGDADIAAAVGALTMARNGMPSISTYVIGVFQQIESVQAQMYLGMLATAGGTGRPFLFMPNEDLAKRLLDALNQIRGAALACEFKIPPPTMGMIDYGKVNVRINEAAASDDLTYVGGADRCDPVRGGWYYDVNPAMGTPTRVLMCDATCKRLKAAPDIKVELRFGCKSRTIE